MGGGGIVGFSVKQGVKTGGKPVVGGGVEGLGRSTREWSFQGDKFLVIPRASSGRTLLQWRYPRTATTTRELLLQAMTTTTTTAVAVAELTARFIGRLMTLIPGTEWQPPAKADFPSRVLLLKNLLVPSQPPMPSRF